MIKPNAQNAYNLVTEQKSPSSSDTEEDMPLLDASMERAFTYDTFAEEFGGPTLSTVLLSSPNSTSDIQIFQDNYEDDDELSGFESDVEAPPLSRRVSRRNSHFHPISSSFPKGRDGAPFHSSTFPRDNDLVILPSREKECGKWKMGLYDCFSAGLCHAAVWKAFCCPQVLMAQVLTRMNMNWLGNSMNETQRNADEIMTDMGLDSQEGYHRRSQSVLTSAPSPFQGLQDDSSQFSFTFSNQQDCREVVLDLSTDPELSILSARDTPLGSKSTPSGTGSSHKYSEDPSPTPNNLSDMYIRASEMSTFTRVFIMTCLFWIGVVILLPPLVPTWIHGSVSGMVAGLSNAKTLAFDSFLQWFLLRTLLMGFGTYTVVVLARLRKAVRARHNILHDDEFQDVAVSLCCLCCSVLQLDQETRDYENDNEIENGNESTQDKSVVSNCCTPTGLGRPLTAPLTDTSVISFPPTSIHLDKEGGNHKNTMSGSDHRFLGNSDSRYHGRL